MPVPSESKSEPHLPREFVRELLSDDAMSELVSQVYSAEFEESRLRIVSCKDTLGPLVTMAFERVQGSTNHEYHSHMERTMLHTAADFGDVLWACEMIRLGTTIDFPDTLGYTPLLQALRAIGLPPIIPLPFEYLKNHHKYRIRYVARTLIEQHADVNVCANGLTPLIPACQAGEWDLIELLIKHGSRPSPPNLKPAIDCFVTRSDKTRFSALLASRGRDSPRPPRLCPCFSGKTLNDCHKASEQPYPSHFVCRCGSGKSFAKCCAQRQRMEVFECWDPNEEWIQPRFRTPLPSGLINVHMELFGGGPYQEFKYVRGGSDTHHRVHPPPHNDLDEIHANFNAVKSMIAAQCRAGKLDIDPAFMYALLHVDFFARAQGRSTSKFDCKEKQELWNNAVDEYIGLGADGRTKIEIERVAKIGNGLGSLYMTCEGSGCEKMEGREVKTLLRCAQCKMAFYCSRTCQKSSWKKHKKACGSWDQIEQELPSQISLMKFFNRFNQLAG